MPWTYFVPKTHLWHAGQHRKKSFISKLLKYLNHGNKKAMDFRWSACTKNFFFDNKNFTEWAQTTPEKFENATIIGYFGFVFKENQVRKITWLLWIVISSLYKSSIFKTLSVHTKTQSRRFPIPPVWRAFLKSSIFVTIIGNGTPNRRNSIKPRFQISPA